MSKDELDRVSNDSHSSEENKKQESPARPAIPGLNLSEEDFYTKLAPLLQVTVAIALALVKSFTAQIVLVAISIGLTYLLVRYARDWQLLRVIKAMSVKQRLSWILAWVIVTLLVYWFLGTAPNAWGSRDPQYKAHDIMPGGYVEVEIVTPCPSLGLITVATGRTNDQDPQSSWSAGQVRLQLRHGSTILAENVNQPHSYMGSTVRLRLPVALDVGKKYQIRAINESRNSIPFLMTGDEEVGVRKYLSVPRTFLSRDRPLELFGPAPRDYFYDGVPDMKIESMCGD